jgi:hypothetical protein
MHVYRVPELFAIMEATLIQSNIATGQFDDKLKEIIKVLEFSMGDIGIKKTEEMAG